MKYKLLLGLLAGFALFVLTFHQHFSASVGIIPVHMENDDAQEVGSNDELTFHELSSIQPNSKMTTQEFRDAFESYIKHIDVACGKTFMLSDERWGICEQEKYRLPERCRVYSFSDAKNGNFESTVAKTYRCIVRLFNPRYPQANQIDRATRSGLYYAKLALGPAYKGLTQSLDAHRNRNGESKIVIAYLKVDINLKSFVDSFKTIFYNGDLTSVKQLAISLKYRHDTSKGILLGVYSILKGLEERGFRKWHQSDISHESWHDHHLIYINANHFLGNITNLLDGQYGLMPAINFNDTTIPQAEEQFQRFAHKLHYRCDAPTRLGHSGDGGWWICSGDRYELKKPCVVYSFGINNDWSFDDDVVKRYGCQVRSFDPSMKASDHKRGTNIHFYKQGLAGKQGLKNTWKMNTLLGFLKDFGETNTTIDVLKADIEFSEWEAFDQALTDGAFANVKQLDFEAHVYIGGDKLQRYKYIYNILKGLEDIGFRRWRVHNNQHTMYTSGSTGKRLTTCIEMSYVKVTK